MEILAGPGVGPLAQGIGKALDARVLEIAARTFPDGERLVRVPTLRPGPVVLVHSTGPCADSRLMELFFILDNLREQGHQVTLVIPFFGYGRQDKAFNPGEVVSAHVVLRIIATYSVERLVFVDPHFHREPGDFTQDDVSCTGLCAAPVVVDAVSGTLDDPLLISPDQGSATLVRSASCNARALSKTRKSDHDVDIDHEHLDVAGRDVVVFDDLVSTGGTMVKAVRMLRQQNARRVVAACTHGLFIEGADERILEAGANELVATDTVPGPYAAISVAELIAGALSRS